MAVPTENAYASIWQLPIAYAIQKVNMNHYPYLKTGVGRSHIASGVA
jgi:hypothetical protein